MFNTLIAKHGAHIEAFNLLTWKIEAVAQGYYHKK